MYIKVKVTAEAKREKIVRKKEDTFEVVVKEKTERNMANKKVLELMAMHFKVPVGKVRIVNGHHRPHKLLSVDI